MAAQTNGQGLMTDINVTPLVDVVLVLLVLMMVTATAMVQKSIPVELPKAKTGESADAQKKLPIVIGVDASGAMFLDTTRVDDDGVRARARGASEAILAADGRAQHSAVVHALELLRTEHVAKIAIVVRAP